MLSYDDGDKYVGEFKNGKRNGQGTLTSVNGSIYEGEYKNDGRHGHATVTLPDGSIYVGEYKDGRQGHDAFLIEPI